jgi:hypothetical protein
MQGCCNRVNLEVVSGYGGILTYKVATTLHHGMMTQVEYRYAYHIGMMRHTQFLLGHIVLVYDPVSGFVAPVLMAMPACGIKNGVDTLPNIDTPRRYSIDFVYLCS